MTRRYHGIYLASISKIKRVSICRREIELVSGIIGTAVARFEAVAGSANNQARIVRWKIIKLRRERERDRERGWVEMEARYIAREGERIRNLSSGASK